MEFCAHSLSAAGGKSGFKVTDEIFLEGESRPRMVNDNQIKLRCELINGEMAKLVERAFFPADANAGMQFPRSVARWRPAAERRGCGPTRCR